MSNAHSLEFQRFDILVQSVLSVSREEIKQREAAYQARANANPKKRGPKKGTKRKAKTSASPVPDVPPLA